MHFMIDWIKDTHDINGAPIYTNNFFWKAIYLFILILLTTSNRK